MVRVAVGGIRSVGDDEWGGKMDLSSRSRVG